MTERDIFIAALQREDPGERRAYLDEACAGQPDLRRQVESLLRLYEGAGSFLEKPAAPSAATGPFQDAAEAASSPEAPGTVIGPYKLVEQIGEGGFGVVFMAEQQESIRRKVALKILKPGMDTRQVVARFEAERQALALMDHPNIAKVLDAGQTSSGRPYFVMDLVKGLPITEFCDQYRLTTNERLELFVSVCQAVQHAHQKGIIHRDIKPSNVLVTLHDGTPVPKIIDFGIAKALGRQLTDKTLVTGFAQLVGTPLYMSPEQAALSGLDVDTRSDIYSLGVLLYELLTGTTPFDKERLKEIGYDELRRIIREEEPPKPSTRISTLGQASTAISTQRKSDPRRLSQLFRGELDWIVMKALEKDRNRRYETASAFAADVQHYLHDEPVQACPPSVSYRLLKLVRRNRGPVLAAAVVLLALVGGIVGTSVGMVRAEWAQQAEAKRAEGETKAKLKAEEAADAERLAKEKAQQAADAEKRAKQKIERGIEILTSVFRNLDPQSEEKEGVSLRLRLGKNLDEAVKQLDGEAVGEPVVVAKLQSLLGQSLLGLGRYDQAEVLLTNARRTLEIALEANHPDTLTAEHNLASLYHLQGKYAPAEKLYNQVLAARSTRLGADHPDNLTAKNDLAAVYDDQGKYAQAETLFKEVLAARSAKSGADHPDTLAAKHGLAWLYHQQGKHALAETLYKEMLSTRIATMGANHPDTLTAKNDLAMLYRDQGQYVQAEALYRETLAAGIANLGAEHPQTLTTKNNLALLYHHQGSHAQAEVLYKEVLAANTANVGTMHPRTLTNKNNLAGLYGSQGKYPQAETLFQEVLEARSARLGADHRDTLSTKNNLAMLWRSMKKLDQSIALHEEMVEQARKKPGIQHPLTVQALANLGVSYLDAGRREDGIRCLEEALAALRNMPSPPPTDLAWVPLGLAQAYDQARQFARSEPVYRELVEQARRQFGADDLQTADALHRLGGNLLFQEKWKDAETAWRDCLAIRQAKQPDGWLTVNAKTALGRALVGQQKYAEAEPLLQQGYSGAKLHAAQMAPPKRIAALASALQGLVRLYESWDKKDDAAKWRTELEAIKTMSPAVKPLPK
jgi:serine/threonine protein kinase